MTHTPGPWHVDGKPGHEAPEIHSKERRIAKALYHRGSEDREVDANAQLIAAAPDLLTACKAWMNWIKGGNLSHEDIIEQTNAAIAKAKGGQ